MKRKPPSFEELHIDRERIWYGEARLSPSLITPTSRIALPSILTSSGRSHERCRFRRWPIGSPSPAWLPPGTSRLRICSSPPWPFAPRTVTCDMKSSGVLSCPHPVRCSPQRCAHPCHFSPRDRPWKVLDEKGTPNTHSILPPSGEGRVILTLEANQLKTSDGRVVDSVGCVTIASWWVA